jgi:dTDP-4-amino-4,6-dideoxygalactose transaminase
VLQSDFLTQGPVVKQFEDAFAEYVGAKYAVAVANGTAALHLNALALGVKPGDKVITTPITFAASANCVRYCGGEVVFADIDPETYLLDIDSVRSLLEASPKGTYVGIIPVDFAGRAVDLEAFRKLVDEYGCWIIEDACHAPGGFFTKENGEISKCGSGEFADLAIFSFHPVKHIATGEGGMITTNNEELYHKLLELRTHGITRDTDKFQNTIDFAIGQPPTAHSSPQTVNRSPLTAYPQWYMEMQTLGYNYRLTDFQAALGLSQLQRAEAGLARRREIATIYFEAFKTIPQITDRNHEAANSEPFTAHRSPLTAHRSPLTAHRSPSSGHAYHLYVIEAQNRLGLYNHLRANQIYAQIHYIPCHLMPYYQEQGWKPGDMEQAEAYYSQCISLPMYPTLTDAEQDNIIEIIKRFYA